MAIEQTTSPEPVQPFPEEEAVSAQPIAVIPVSLAAPRALPAETPETANAPATSEAVADNTLVVSRDGPPEDQGVAQLTDPVGEADQAQVIVGLETAQPELPLVVIQVKILI